MLWHLRGQYRFYVPDLPGHGESARDMNGDYRLDTLVAWLADFAAAVRLDRFHVMGISLGGMLAGLFAARHPAATLSCTMLCPAGVLGARPSPFLEQLQSTGRNLLLPQTMAEADTMLRSVLAHPERRFVPRKFMEVFVAQSRANLAFNQRFLQQLLADDSRRALMDAVPQIACPVLLVWGAQDRIFDVSGAEVLHQRIPHAAVHVLPDCGHSIYHECAAALARLFAAAHAQ